jgi:hypothetical protein
MKRELLLIIISIYSMNTFSMGSDRLAKKVSAKRDVAKDKRILVHVLDPDFGDNNKYLKREIYQIVLDEVISTENFSLLINRPSVHRKARIKFIEIHTELKADEVAKGTYSVGVFMSDGNSGNVIMQKVKKRVSENRIRFYIRKTLRSFFFKDNKSKLKIDSELALMNEQNLFSEQEDKKKKTSSSLKSGSSYNPLFNKRQKRINISGGDNSKEQNSKYATDSYEDLIPYSFKKKKQKNSIDLENGNKKMDTSGANIRTNPSSDVIFSGRSGQDKDLIFESDVQNYQKEFGLPELLSKELNSTLEEYAQDPENLSDISENEFASKKKGLKGESKLEDSIFGENARDSEFNKTTREPGQTIYSVALNFTVNKIQSSDTIDTTNNFKQVGLAIYMDKFIEGKRGGKVSGSFAYSMPIDFDQQFDIPGSMSAKAGYHKSFNDFFLGVAGLEYERQFFVNVAKSGESLQAWSNTLIWYRLGFDLDFELLSMRTLLSAYFSKPFIGTTDYGGEDNRTMDGNRVYGQICLELFRSISFKSEIIWSEMTSQGFSDLKNRHLTSATYLIYSF